MCGRLDGVGVGLPAQGPHLCLHLRGAARHPTGADLQVDACAKKGSVGVEIIFCGSD